MDEIKIIDEIAADLGASESNRAKWIVRGSVPHRWRLPILEAAAKRGVLIDPAKFELFRRAAA